MENKELETKICDSVEKTLEQLVVDDEIREQDVKFIGDLIDIKKDIANMNYWEAKEETMEMRYMGRGRGNYGANGNYGGNYGANGNYGGNYGARGRNSRGQYSDGGNYGANGNYGRNYRGHEILDDMSNTYGTYMEGKERYGADEGTMKSLEYMLQSVEDFMYMLKEDANSQEEVQMIKETARRISEM